MHGRAGMTIGKLLVGVVVGGILLWFIAAILIPFLNSNTGGMPGRTVCMWNLSSIGKSIIIYKGENDGAWPWIGNVTNDWSAVPVGTNRNRDPFKDANSPGERSMTSLMFMLVRMNQSPGMFRCPSDRNSEVDLEVKAGTDDGDVLEGEYYWDFSKPQNVSYSWQAPIWQNGRFVQGIDGNETESVMIADMTPAATKPGWKPADVSKLNDDEFEAQISPNHGGKQVNILRVAGHVQPQKRPDVGLEKDNIYTASGDPNTGSRSATSLDIRKHLSPRDTFLIGPVGRKAE